MFWDEKIECMSKEDMEELQLKRLQDVVKTAFNEVPYYHKRYTEEEVFPEDIECLKDIEKLPFITKDDLRESYPYGLFAVDMSEIKELHSLNKALILLTLEIFHLDISGIDFK